VSECDRKASVLRRSYRTFEKKKPIPPIFGVHHSSPLEVHDPEGGGNTLLRNIGNVPEDLSIYLNAARISNLRLLFVSNLPVYFTYDICQ
jgi:hypothetical protein